MNQTSTSKIRSGRLAESLRRRPLTEDEIAARDAAVASGGHVEATLEGQLLKRPTPEATPREVMQAPESTWD